MASILWYRCAKFLQLFNYCIAKCYATLVVKFKSHNCIKIKNKDIYNHSSLHFNQTTLAFSECDSK